MKKLVIFALTLTLMAISLLGCSSTPKCFTGEWKFSSIEKVELSPELSNSEIDNLKEMYNAEDEAGIIAKALERFTADSIFTPCYLKFDKKVAYAYDPFGEREATWAFYKLSDTEGFLSVYTELEVTDSNPYPVINPDLVYDAETDTMSFTMNYASFMVTVKLVR